MIGGARDGPDMWKQRGTDLDGPADNFRSLIQRPEGRCTDLANACFNSQ